MLALRELEKLDYRKGHLHHAESGQSGVALAPCKSPGLTPGRTLRRVTSTLCERRWLLIDVDPERPSGISATDAEKAAAQKKAREIYRFLKERGWPEPVVADSGNGYHLLYRIDLPCDDGKVLEQRAGCAC